MANIQSNLNKIKNAVLGIEVRDSIHDAIKQCYDDASAKDNANMEVKMARGEYENLGKRLDSHSSQIKDLENNITFYRAKQTELLTTVIYKNIKNIDLSICCQGDSLTAGGQQTSTVNYPKYLQLILQEISETATISVTNRGHGGDTTALSYNRWTTNPNCHLHLLMLGTNDQYAGLTIQESYNNILKIIKRIIDWDSAVVLLTPPRKKDYDSDIMSFNLMIKYIGEMLNIPVIDTSKGLEGYPNTELYVSDNVHLTDKGYYVLANYISSFFIGSTLIKNDNLNLLGGKHITMDGWQGYMRLNGADKISSRIKYASSSKFGVGSTRDEGSYIEIKAGGQLNIAFNSLVDNLYLFPYFEIVDNAECQIILNYRSDPALQSCRYTDETLPSSVENNPITKQYYSNSSKLNKRYNSDYIVCTRQGINQLYIKNVGSGTIKFMGFYVMSAEEFKLHKECMKIPIIKTGTVTTTETTGRIDFDTAFNNIIGVVFTVDKYQSTDGKVTYYNQSTSGFNYTVDSVGVKFRWMAFGY